MHGKLHVYQTCCNDKPRWWNWGWDFCHRHSMCTVKPLQKGIKCILAPIGWQSTNVLVKHWSTANQLSTDCWPMIDQQSVMVGWQSALHCSMLLYTGYCSAKTFFYMRLTIPTPSEVNSWRHEFLHKVTVGLVFPFIRLNFSFAAFSNCFLCFECASNVVGLLSTYFFSANSRLTVDWWVGQPSTDSRPTVDRPSTDGSVNRCHPMGDKYTWATGKGLFCSSIGQTSLWHREFCVNSNSRVSFHFQRGMFVRDYMLRRISLFLPTGLNVKSFAHYHLGIGLYFFNTWTQTWALREMDWFLWINPSCM